MKLFALFSTVLLNAIIGLALSALFNGNAMLFAAGVNVLAFGLATYFPQLANYIPCNTAIAAGFAQPVNCTKAVGGFEDSAIYIGNEADITSATASSTDGEVTDLVLAATKTLFKLEVEKDSFMVKDELQEDGTYTQTVEFDLKSDTALERKFVTSLKGSRLVFIGRDRNGRFPMVGFQYGSNATPASALVDAVGIELSGQTNDWSIENFGRHVIMTGIGFKEPMPYFFETSLSATVANLEDYLTA